MIPYIYSNMVYDTVSTTQSYQVTNQIAIYISKYNLEEISLRLFEMNKNNQIEYSIKEDVLTKAERKLENMQNKYYKEYNSIIVDNKKVILLKPVVFLVEQNNDGYYFINMDLNIIAGGDSFENAEKNMYEEFMIQWDLYVNEDNDALTLKAQKIKKNLQESVKL